MTSHWIIAYVITAAVFLTFDLLWLSYVAKSFYFNRLGHLLRQRPKMGVAASFYLVYVVGVVFFAIIPALSAGKSEIALLYGAIFGFFAYATYDITNFATLKNWPWSVTLVDITWGTLLTAISAYCGAHGTLSVMGV